MPFKTMTRMMPAPISWVITPIRTKILVPIIAPIPIIVTSRRPRSRLSVTVTGWRVEELDIWVDVMNCAGYKALRWVFEALSPVWAASKSITGIQGCELAMLAKKSVPGYERLSGDSVCR